MTLFYQKFNMYLCSASMYRADSGFAPSQWETALLCNAISHWLGASLQSALMYVVLTRHLPVNFVSGIAPALYMVNTDVADGDAGQIRSSLCMQMAPIDIVMGFQTGFATIWLLWLDGHSGSGTMSMTIFVENSNLVATMSGCYSGFGYLITTKIYLHQHSTSVMAI